MSGTASVGNTFQSAVTATGLQLDQNYSTIVAYLNDPTNRNNFATDSSGGTNTIVLTFSPAVAGGYTAGLEITFKAALTNNGPVVLNANGIGNANLVNADGSALAAGQVTAGSVYQAAYDGTRFIFISPSGAPQVAASQAALETATATVGFPVPATMKFHPGVAKAAGWFDGTATGTITAGSAFLSAYGVSQMVRQGAGTYSFTLTPPMANTQYVAALCVGSSLAASALRIPQELTGARTTNGFVIIINTTSTTAVDITSGNFMVYGDLP